MRICSGAAAVVPLFALLACSGDNGDELVLRISSPLEIGTETNLLVASVQPMGGTSRDQSYELGKAPRTSWPQTLPIVGGPHSDRSIAVSVELRNSLPGMASVAVGYVHEMDQLPQNGVKYVDLNVPRNCVDHDGDGFGVGFGCKGPDCDDNNPMIPCPIPCPPTDAGVESGDGGLDPGDGGGHRHDAGLDCSNGGPMCDADHVCFMGQCLKRCMSSNDCGDLAFGCIPFVDVCACKVPCLGPIDCGMNECVDGCCKI